MHDAAIDRAQIWLIIEYRHYFAIRWRPSAWQSVSHRREKCVIRRGIKGPVFFGQPGQGREQIFSRKPLTVIAHERGNMFTIERLRCFRGGGEQSFNCQNFTIQAPRPTARIDI